MEKRQRRLTWEAVPCQPLLTFYRPHYIPAPAALRRRLTSLSRYIKSSNLFSTIDTTHQRNVQNAFAGPVITRITFLPHLYHLAITCDILYVEARHSAIHGAWSCPPGDRNNLLDRYVLTLHLIHGNFPLSSCTITGQGHEFRKKKLNFRTAWSECRNWMPKLKDWADTLTAAATPSGMVAPQFMYRL